MPLTTAALIAKHSQLWQAATHHPFLDRVRDGTLPRDAMLRWLVQDYQFLYIGLLPFQSLLLPLSAREHQLPVARGLVALVEELGWFEEQLAAFAAPPADEIEPHESCIAYVDYLLELSTVDPDDMEYDPYPQSITALWAIERAYLDAWRTTLPAAPAYRAFAEHWTAPVFVDYVAALATAADAALAEAEDADEAAADATFRRIAELEKRFWDIAVPAAAPPLKLQRTRPRRR